MQDLKVIGVENGALVAVGDDGERFRIAVDEALQSKVRQVRQETPADAPKLSPREVQAHIRSGMSAEDVAAVTGAPLEYVQRFEGPILAEREHIVAERPQRARAHDRRGRPARRGGDVRHASSATDSHRSVSPASAGRAGRTARPAGSSSSSSQPTPSTTTRAGAYDARKHALAPAELRGDHALPAGRAARGAHPPAARRAAQRGRAGHSRFDSGAFTFPAPAPCSARTTPLRLEPVAYGRPSPAATQLHRGSAIKRPTTPPETCTRPQTSWRRCASGGGDRRPSAGGAGAGGGAGRAGEHRAAQRGRRGAGRARRRRRCRRCSSALASAARASQAHLPTRSGSSAIGARRRGAGAASSTTRTPTCASPPPRRSAHRRHRGARGLAEGARDAGEQSSCRRRRSRGSIGSARRCRSRVARALVGRRRPRARRCSTRSGTPATCAVLGAAGRRAR